MKKLISLFAVLCMLFSLAACKQPADKTDGTGDSKNAVTQNGETNAQNPSQQDKDQPEETENKQENTSETEEQQKEETGLFGGLLYGEPLYIHGSGMLEQGDSQLPKVLDYDTYCNIEGYIAMKGKESYSEAFFENHSVILIGIDELNLGSRVNLSEFIYADGVVSCAFDLPWVKYTASLPASGYFYCMITVDTVLPPDTKIEVKIKPVEVDMETYEQMTRQFVENSI